MTFPFARRSGAALTVSCLLIVTGCTPPPGSGTTTSPVERYLKSGQAQQQQNDFDGALAAYEKALSIDMNNPTVHYQLALLFDTDLNQPEKSLYHFTRVLELNPDYRWSDMIKDRLPALRMRVSGGSIPLLPNAELEKIIAQLHRDLAAKNADLQRLSGQMEEMRRRYQAFASNTPQAPAQQQQPHQQFSQIPEPEPQREIPTQSAPQTREPRVVAQPQAPAAESQRLQYSPPKRISYKVLKGDTLYGLGRRYGVDQNEILRANPGLTAASLQIGETIVIPGQ